MPRQTYPTTHNRQTASDLCRTAGCDATARAAGMAGGTSRVTTCAGGTLATPPFLSLSDVAVVTLSLDVTYMLRALSLRCTVAAGSVENSCYVPSHEASKNITH